MNSSRALVAAWFVVAGCGGVKYARDAAADVAMDSVPPPRDAFPVDNPGDGSSVDATIDLGELAPDAKVDAGPQLPPYVREVLADKPLAYWRLEESSGSTAKDEVGGYSGKYHGACTRGVVGAIASQGGGAALGFDGFSCYVEVPAFKVFGGKDSFTLEAWARPSVIDGVWRRLLTHQGLEPMSDGYTIWVYDESPKRYGLTVWQAGESTGDAKGEAAVGSYAHVVITFAAGTSRIYIDGNFEDEKPAGDSFLVAAGAPLYIGTHNAFDGFFDGSIDEVAVYGKVLSQVRIKAHHDAAMLP